MLILNSDKFDSERGKLCLVIFCQFGKSKMATEQVLDHLKLQSNIQIQQLLNKYGENFPQQEIIKYSGSFTKINKREKSQKRIILLTNKAIYNIKPSTFDKPQRRIKLSKISSITVSETSNEFTINIPMEYDYRYIAKDSQQREELTKIISTIYESSSSIPLRIHKVTTPSTAAYTVTKKVANETVKNHLPLLQLLPHQITLFI